MNKKTLIIGVIAIVILLFLMSLTSYKTYKNDTYKFLVQYPGSWKAVAEDDISGKTFYTASQKTSCRVYAFSNEDEFKSENTDQFIETLYPEESGVEIIDKRDVLLANKPAVEIYSKQNEYYQHAVYAIDDTMGYGIYCIYENLEQKERNSVMFHKMLETFKIYE